MTKKLQQNIEAFFRTVMSVDKNRPGVKASRLLPRCSGENSFYVCDGSIYSSLYELVEGLRTMKQETFKYHVNQQKNDFMNWARDVFGDQLLAKEIAKIQHPVGMAKKIEARIKILQKI